MRLDTSLRQSHTAWKPNGDMHRAVYLAGSYVQSSFRHIPTFPVYQTARKVQRHLSTSRPPTETLPHKIEENHTDRMIMALPLGAIQLTVVSCITTAMAIAATMLRLWSRYLQNHSLVLHDYLALAGMFLTACTVGVYLAGEMRDRTPSVVIDAYLTATHCSCFCSRAGSPRPRTHGHCPGKVYSTDSGNRIEFSPLYENSKYGRLIKSQ